MPFPTHKPASRSYSSGDYPVKAFRSQSGVETRILYGDTRTGMSLDLSFENITDTQASEFLTHFAETKGTYLTFTIPSQTLAGWSGSTTALDAASANRWRYKDEPQISSVRPGISSVQVSLVGVL
jgi:hypothetical protein